MLSEQISIPSFSSFLSPTVETISARKNAGFHEIISTSMELESDKIDHGIEISLSNRNRYENRRSISSTFNISISSELTTVENVLSHSILTAANVSSQNFLI